MRISAIAALLAAAVLLGACNASAPPTKPAASNEPARVAIPSLQFVPLSAFSPKNQPEPGATVAAGTYKPLMSGEHIVSATWIKGGSADAPEFVLHLTFDDAGRATLARWTTAHVGESMAVLLGDRVLQVAEVAGPLTDGSIVLGGPTVTGMRSEIDSATVATP